MLASFASLVAARPAGRQAPARRSREERPTSRPATARSPTSAPCTCSSSTPAPSAASATRPARPTPPGRPLSPRDVILELREQANAAMREIGVGGVLGALMRGQAPGNGALQPSRGRRRRRARRDGLVVHAVQRLRRDLPGGHRAGADHQPAAPAPGRGGRAARQPAGDAPDDPQVGQLLRRERAASAAAGREELDFEVKDARKEPVDVLWFVGDYASFDPRSPEGDPRRWRGCSTRPRSTSGSSTTASATPATTCAGSGEEGLFEALAEQNIATLAECDVQPHRHERPALAQHAAQRVPRASPRAGAPGTWRTTPRSCSS